MLRRRIESNENVQVYVDTSSAIIMFWLQHYQLKGHKWLILADNIPEIIWCNTAQDLVDMRWNFRLQSYLCWWSVTSLNMKLTWLATSQPIVLSSLPPPLARTSWSIWYFAWIPPWYVTFMCKIQIHHTPLLINI